MGPESRRLAQKPMWAVTKIRVRKYVWRGYSIYLESLQHRYRYQIEVARNREIESRHLKII